MTKLSDVFQGDSLKASDLQGREITLTIARWHIEDFDDGKKVSLSFEETERTLICNKTNAFTIADALGTQEISEWVGASVVIYPTKTDFQGKRVDCIRIKSATRRAGVTAPPLAIPDGPDVPF